MEFIDVELYGNLRGIYRIRNIINDKVYIGQTSENFKRRYLHHRWKLNNGSHDNSYLQRAYNKYGAENFVFEVVHIVEDTSLLDDLEILYIEQSDNRYNMLLGGGGRRGYAMKDSTKKLIGKANKEHMTGRVASEKTKQKMSTSQKARYAAHPNDNRTLSVDTATQIKKMIIDGKKLSEISDQLGVSYKIVNGILSYDTYKDAIVDGWDKFQSERRRSNRLTRADVLEIVKKYNCGFTIDELAKQYNRSPESICGTIKRNQTLK